MLSIEYVDTSVLTYVVRRTCVRTRAHGEKYIASTHSLRLQDVDNRVYSHRPLLFDFAQNERRRFRSLRLRPLIIIVSVTGRIEE